VVTHSASAGRLGLEPAGQRLLLAAARLPYAATAFLANLERCARSAAGRAGALFAVIAAAYVVGAELAWHHFSSGLLASLGGVPQFDDICVLAVSPLGPDRAQEDVF